MPQDVWNAIEKLANLPSDGYFSSIASDMRNQMGAIVDIQDYAPGTKPSLVLTSEVWQYSGESMMFDNDAMLNTVITNGINGAKSDVSSVQQAATTQAKLVGNHYQMFSGILHAIFQQMVQVEQAANQKISGG